MKFTETTTVDDNDGIGI